MMPEPVKILLVEDDPGDVRLTKEALKDSKITNELIVVDSAEAAFNYLESSTDLEPAIILLDLNLPGLDGREFLKMVKEDGRFKHIPVVVLTTSKSEEDIIKSYKAHCNSYITKPINISQLTMIVKSISEYWFTIVRLPNQE